MNRIDAGEQIPVLSLLMMMWDLEAQRRIYRDAAELPDTGLDTGWHKKMAIQEEMVEVELENLRQTLLERGVK